MGKQRIKVTNRLFPARFPLLCFTDGYQCFKNAASRHATGIPPVKKLVTAYKSTRCHRLEDHNLNLTFMGPCIIRIF